MPVENQKIENALNLALEATEEERDKSLDLAVGYNEELETWDVIVKYSGDASGLLERYNGVNLINEYAILNVPESSLSILAADPQVEYIEKPKSLYYERKNGLRTSCITGVQSNKELYGEGVIVAVIDSGIDYTNTEFRNTDGSTRILKLWDQSQKGNPPVGYNIGDEYDSSNINEALEAPTQKERLAIVPSVDTSGHGTQVASVAAGTNGVANKSDLLIVKLGTPQRGGFPRTVELMLALNYVIEEAIKMGKPIAINMSFGNTYGAHDGTSLLERFIDDISNRWKSCICVSSGNEGNGAGHFAGKLELGTIDKVELAIASRQTGMNVQLWKPYEDDVNISITTPGGERIGPLRKTLGTQRYRSGSTELLIYYGEPSPYSVLQEIYIEFIPTEDYVMEGIWELDLEPVKIVTGEYNLWLPSLGVLSIGTNFLRSTKDNTITIPSTAQRVITVGAYDSLTYTYADFSGRGRSIEQRLVKPDLMAPGVDVLVSGVGGNVRLASGTSFSAPFVTGSTALMMEWGIVRGNDPFLYGEKVKAYLRKGARPLPGMNILPNNLEGYGTLCLEESLEV